VDNSRGGIAEGRELLEDLEGSFFGLFLGFVFVDFVERGSGGRRVTTSICEGVVGGVSPVLEGPASGISSTRGSVGSAFIAKGLIKRRREGAGFFAVLPLVGVSVDGVTGRRKDILGVIVGVSSSGIALPLPLLEVEEEGVVVSLEGKDSLSFNNGTLGVDDSAMMCGAGGAGNRFERRLLALAFVNQVDERSGGYRHDQLAATLAQKKLYT
jgi:hypothetical protein